jgi:hypothetical protein
MDHHIHSKIPGTFSQFLWIEEERERVVPILDMEECDLSMVIGMYVSA